jgi:hypothetical protein
VDGVVVPVAVVVEPEFRVVAAALEKVRVAEGGGGQLEAGGVKDDGLAEVFVGVAESLIPAKPKTPLFPGEYASKEAALCVIYGIMYKTRTSFLRRNCFLGIGQPLRKNFLCNA